MERTLRPRSETAGVRFERGARELVRFSPASEELRRLDVMRFDGAVVGLPRLEEDSRKRPLLFAEGALGVSLASSDVLVTRLLRRDRTEDALAGAADFLDREEVALRFRDEEDPVLDRAVEDFGDGLFSVSGWGRRSPQLGHLRLLPSLDSGIFSFLPQEQVTVRLIIPSRYCGKFFSVRIVRGRWTLKGRVCPRKCEVGGCFSSGLSRLRRVQEYEALAEVQGWRQSRGRFVPPGRGRLRR